MENTSNTHFSKGQTVKLNSGGPIMRIESRKPMLMVAATWKDVNGQSQRDYFPEATLTAH
jgi:uncharacterized protein YodC (DUF2158 family)